MNAMLIRTVALTLSLAALVGQGSSVLCAKTRSDNAEAVARSAVVTPILGTPEVSPERMWEFVRTVNSDFPIEIARAYYEVGLRYGVRGDIALCQAIVETGWFRFTDGTAVTADQHNYCGMGVITRGMKGHSFDSIEQGVTAQIQHLYAYACRQSLPPGEPLIDPRFKMVSRGVAPAWEDLSLRWAANARYGQSILALYEKMAASVLTVEEIGIEIPEELMNELTETSHEN